MEPVRKIFQNISTPLMIELPEGFKNKDVEVIVWPLENEKKEASGNDLSEFFGKMKWAGDALAEQKKIRDEWD